MSHISVPLVAKVHLKVLPNP